MSNNGSLIDLALDLIGNSDDIAPTESVVTYSNNNQSTENYTSQTYTQQTIQQTQFTLYSPTTKRGRGRPKGSKNKPKSKDAKNDDTKRKRGRPKTKIDKKEEENSSKKIMEKTSQKCTSNQPEKISNINEEKKSSITQPTIASMNISENVPDMAHLSNMIANLPETTKEDVVEVISSESEEEKKQVQITGQNVYQQLIEHPHVDHQISSMPLGSTVVEEEPTPPPPSNEPSNTTPKPKKRGRPVQKHREISFKLFTPSNMKSPNPKPQIIRIAQEPQEEEIIHVPPRRKTRRVVRRLSSEEDDVSSVSESSEEDSDYEPPTSFRSLPEWDSTEPIDETPPVEETSETQSPLDLLANTVSQLPYEEQIDLFNPPPRRVAERIPIGAALVEDETPIIPYEPAPISPEVVPPEQPKDVEFTQTMYTSSRIVEELEAQEASQMHTPKRPKQRSKGQKIFNFTLLTQESFDPSLAKQKKKRKANIIQVDSKTKQKRKKRKIAEDSETNEAPNEPPNEPPESIQTEQTKKTNINTEEIISEIMDGPPKESQQEPVVPPVTVSPKMETKISIVQAPRVDKRKRRGRPPKYATIDFDSVEDTPPNKPIMKHTQQIEIPKKSQTVSKHVDLILSEIMQEEPQQPPENVPQQPPGEEQEKVEEVDQPKKPKRGRPPSSQKGKMFSFKLFTPSDMKQTKPKRNQQTIELITPETVNKKRKRGRPVRESIQQEEPNQPPQSTQSTQPTEPTQSTEPSETEEKPKRKRGRPKQKKEEEEEEKPRKKRGRPKTKEQSESPTKNRGRPPKQDQQPSSSKGVFVFKNFVASPQKKDESQNEKSIVIDE